MGYVVYGSFPAPCPQCGYDDSWGDFGCMDCGLEFFPPSEAYWAASTLTVAERVSSLLEDWDGPVARERTRDPWDWCTPDDPEPPAIAPLPDSASYIEKIFWDAHCKLALPELQGLVFQHRVGKFRLDFALPDLMIGIELDGFRNHSRAADVASDHLRQRWLGGLRWYIMRFGGPDVCRDAIGCVQQAAFLTGIWGKVPS